MSFRHEMLRIEPSEVGFYTIYTGKLNVIYAEADEIFRTAFGGIDPHDEVSTQTSTVDNKTGRFQFTDRRRLPFEFEKACATIWSMLSSQRQNLNQINNSIEDPENTVVTKFRVTTRFKTGAIGSIVQRIVARCYHENDREVTVWQVFAEGERIFTGMQAEEIGWSDITRLNEPGKEQSVKRLCARYFPMHFSSGKARATVVDQFTDLIVGVGSSSAIEISNRIEKELLKEYQEML